MARVSVSTIASIHCRREQLQHMAGTPSNLPFKPLSLRRLFIKNRYSAKCTYLQRRREGGNGVFASSLRRPDTRLSIVSAFLSARLSDLLSALLIWMIRFRCNWFPAIWSAEPVDHVCMSVCLCVLKCRLQLVHSLFCRLCLQPVCLRMRLLDYQLVQLIHSPVSDHSCL